MRKPTTLSEDLARRSPTAWFAVLERARLNGDVSLEAHALEQLRRLGVDVKFIVDPAAKPAAPDAASEPSASPAAAMPEAPP